MNNYFKIFKNISTKTSKIYNLTNESFFQVLCCRISYSVTPLLIILKLNPNFLTLINFAISILMGIFFNYLIEIFENKLIYEETFKSAYLIGVIVLGLSFYILTTILIKAFKISDIHLKY